MKGVCDVFFCEPFAAIYDVIYDRFGKPINGISVSVKVPFADGHSFIFSSLPGQQVRRLVNDFAFFSRAEHDRFAEYVGRFCFFFRDEFFLPKLFQRIVDCGLADKLPKIEGVKDVRYWIWNQEDEEEKKEEEEEKKNALVERESGAGPLSQERRKKGSPEKTSAFERGTEFRVDRAKRVFSLIPGVTGRVAASSSWWVHLVTLLAALWAAMKNFFS